MCGVRLFTCGADSAGAPDKVCDMIAEKVLYKILAADENAKADIKAALFKNSVCIYGEVETGSDIQKEDLKSAARKIIERAGYMREGDYINTSTCEIDVEI